MTVKGICTRPSASVRLPDALMATIWRPTPAGLRTRFHSRRARSAAASGSRWAGLPQVASDCRARSIASSSVAGGAPKSSALASAVGWPTSRSPVVDMIDTTERTTSGCSMAMACTIIPPIDAPTTCAGAMPSSSSRAAASAAMSDSV